MFSEEVQKSPKVCHITLLGCSLPNRHTHSGSPVLLLSRYTKCTCMCVSHHYRLSRYTEPPSPCESCLLLLRWIGVGVKFLLLPCSSLFLFSLKPSGFLFSCVLTGLSCSSLFPLAAVVANPAISGLLYLSRSVVLPPAYVENIDT